MTDAQTIPDANLHPLTRYRRRNGLSLNAFAARVPCTAATISRIESGSREPKVPLLRQIVAATRQIEGDEGITADEIIHFAPAVPGRAA